jgi:predicted NodU family carbamoyl transferase
MRILSFNPSHDGAAVLLEDERLIYSLESEKDDWPRHDRISTSLFLRSMSFEKSPDVVAMTGLYKHESFNMEAGTDPRNKIGAGYHDESNSGVAPGELLFAGNNLRYFTSSHVRSHIMCAYGMSPFPMGEPCYALVWEGEIGSFYYIDSGVQVRKVGEVLFAPGNRYAFLYALATGAFDGDPPGKIMALAAYGQRREPTSEERKAIDSIMTASHGDLIRAKYAMANSTFGNTLYYKVGVESQEFKDLVYQFSVALFDRFYKFAERHVTRGLPLIISGGCGLNCEWNSQWRDCGLFSDVFVPPCPNDSGVAIGTAVDAMHYYHGKAKIQWTVYSGDPFINDALELPQFERSPLDLGDLSQRLMQGQIIAWVQGRYEIGPRALGNRSLIAEPFSTTTRDRLNRIKKREMFRPVAPICLEEDFDQHFDHPGPSPHMLYFQKVKNRKLEAITHVDGSARAQSINERENPEAFALLRAFKEKSGAGVLCNTSLNFNGRGFINRMTHLFSFALERELDAIVVGNQFWRRRWVGDG